MVPPGGEVPLQLQYLYSYEYEYPFSLPSYMYEYGTRTVPYVPVWFGAHHMHDTVCQHEGASRARIYGMEFAFDDEGTDWTGLDNWFPAMNQSASGQAPVYWYVNCAFLGLSYFASILWIISMSWSEV